MSEIESLERRLVEIERKLDSLLSRQPSPQVEAKSQSKRASSRTSRVFWGIFILVVGLIWLGESLQVSWLEDFKYWPFALIVFGLYLIFGT